MFLDKIGEAGVKSVRSAWESTSHPLSGKGSASLFANEEGSFLEGFTVFIRGEKHLAIINNGGVPANKVWLSKRGGESDVVSAIMAWIPDRGIQTKNVKRTAFAIIKAQQFRGNPKEDRFFTANIDTSAISEAVSESFLNVLIQG